MASTRWEKEREALCRVCRHLVNTGLVVGSSGNVSMRLKTNDDDLVLITPRGLALERLTPHELAVVGLEGEAVDEDLPPSSESALHLLVYRRRPDVGSIVHTHPVFSSVSAVSGLEIPPIIDEVAIKVGGSVQVADYAFPGTEELAEKAVIALGDRMAVLLRNHGLVTVGKTAEEALDNSLLVERLAQIFTYANLSKGVNSLPAEVVKIEEELYRMHQTAERANGGPHGIGT